TNGKPPMCGNKLIGALTHFGIDAMDAVEKERMRALALRGGPWTLDERKALLDYCEADVIALAKLLPRMLLHIDLPRALLRGRYMIAAARIEHVGVPIDVPALATLRHFWAAIQDELIRKVDADYNVYEGRTFKRARFEQWLARHGIPWPQLP